WEAAGGQYSVAMTAFAGLALLSEGSTTREGKHADALRRAVAWMLAHARPDGCISEPKNTPAAGRYMMSHGYALLFLSQVYAGEAQSVLAVQWLNYAQSVVPVTAAAKLNSLGHDEFIHFYFAQACHHLGEEGHAKMRPDLARAEKEGKATNAVLKWSRYRAVM